MERIQSDLSLKGIVNKSESQENICQVVHRWLSNTSKTGNSRKNEQPWNSTVMGFDVGSWKITDKWDSVPKRKTSELITQGIFSVNPAWVCENIMPVTLCKKKYREIFWSSNFRDVFFCIILADIFMSWLLASSFIYIILMICWLQLVWFEQCMIKKMFGKLKSAEQMESGILEIIKKLFTS